MSAKSTPLRRLSLSREAYLVELSSEKINDKKHTDRLRNCLFINRVYELALEEEDSQRKQRQQRKRSVNLYDDDSKRLRVDERLSDDESDSTEEEDLNDLSDSDEPEDEGVLTPPSPEPHGLEAEIDRDCIVAAAAL